MMIQFALFFAFMGSHGLHGNHGIHSPHGIYDVHRRRNPVG